LSRQIAELERRLDVVLFERTSRTVRLTVAGSALLSEARGTLDQAAGVVAAAQRVGREEVGSLGLGFLPAAMNDVLPRLVAASGCLSARGAAL
jgi:DNA-binding transcriptional LysR family regulator